MDDFRTLPVWELQPMVEHVLAPTAWSNTEENLAMLVDRLAFWLDQMWGQWTIDPDDPEVKRAREERKRSGQKPPPVPLVPPVAKRPPEQDAAVREQVQALKEHFSAPPATRVNPGETKMDALDRLLGGG